MADSSEGALALELEALLDAASVAAGAELLRPLAERDDAALDDALAAFRRHRRELTAVASSRGHRGSAAAQGALSRARRRLRRVPALLDAVERIRAAEPKPLYPLPPRRTVWTEQARISDAVLLSMHRMVTPLAQSPGVREYGCFADIPMPPAKFLAHALAAARLMMALKRPRPWRFLDVGAGGGIKVLLAAELFEAADGLEYDPGHAAAAQRMVEAVGAERCRMIRGDALEFTDYGAYDVIYFYRPMIDVRKLRQMEERILAQARPGTVLIAPYESFGLAAPHPGCAEIEGALHVVGLDPGEAAAIRDEAMHMGTDAPVPVLTDPELGFLLPLVEGCRMNGHMPALPPDLQL